jgi:hypothetical protein
VFSVHVELWLLRYTYTSRLIQLNPVKLFKRAAGVRPKHGNTTGSCGRPHFITRRATLPE